MQHGKNLLGTCGFLACLVAHQWFTRFIRQWRHNYQTQSWTHPHPRTRIIKPEKTSLYRHFVHHIKKYSHLYPISYINISFYFPLFFSALFSTRFPKQKHQVAQPAQPPSGPSGNDGADEDDTNDPRGQPRRDVLQLFHGEQNAR